VPPLPLIYRPVRCRCSGHFRAFVTRLSHCRNGSVMAGPQNFDFASVDIVDNTDLHFDHCGNIHLFADRPINVQRRELDDARSKDGYTVHEWVDAPGIHYVPIEGEYDLLPGMRLVPAPWSIAVGPHWTLPHRWTVSPRSNMPMKSIIFRTLVSDFFTEPIRYRIA
jgi:hypothetical protein